MRKILQASCFTAILFLSAGVARAQYPGSDPGEVTVGGDLSKLASNDSNYASKYKPPDWYLQAFKWAQSISQLFHGFFTPGVGQNASLNPVGVPEVETSPDAYTATGPPAHTKYYMSYGLGLSLCMRGGKFPYAGGDDIDHIVYLQIPIPMVRFNYILQGGSVVYAEGGAYYGIALGGGWKSTGGSGDTHGTLKFGNNIAGDDYRRGDPRRGSNRQDQ